MRGYNGTVFVYGQTSSGKTHTMSGSPSQPGLIPLAVQHIFRYIEQATDKRFLLRMSYLEVYNEEVNDLLDPSKKNLNVRQRADKSFFAEDLTETIVRNVDDVMALIARGERNRQVGSSNLHDKSSRSHSIFRTVIEVMDRDEEGEAAAAAAAAGGARRGGKKSATTVCTAELNLVDLAGSESLVDTASAKTKKETGAINISLYQLTNVISALSKGDSFVPYRNSTLTKFLRQSLGGNARTALVCTITPAEQHKRESTSTLRFGQRAKEIKNTPQVNVVADGSSSAVLTKYRTQIASLTERLQEMEALSEEKAKIQRDFEDLQRQLSVLREKELERSELERELAEMNGQIVDSSAMHLDLEEAQRAAQEKEREATQLNAQLTTMELRNRELKREVETEAAAKIKAQMHIEEKEAALRAMAEENASLGERLASEASARERATCEFQTREAELQQMAEKHRSLEKQLRAEGEAREKTEQEMRSRLAQLEADAQARLRELEGNKDRELADLRRALDSEKSARVDAQSRNTELESKTRDRLSQLNLQGVDRDGELARMIFNYESDIMMLRAENGELLSEKTAQRLELEDRHQMEMDKERRRFDQQLSRMAIGVETIERKEEKGKEKAVEAEADSDATLASLRRELVAMQARTTLATEDAAESKRHAAELESRLAEQAKFLDDERRYLVNKHQEEIAIMELQIEDEIRENLALKKRLGL